MINVLEYLENSAERFPDKVAFSDETAEITFSEFLNRAKKVGTEIAKKVKANKDISNIFFIEFHQKQIKTFNSLGSKSLE